MEWREGRLSEPAYMIGRLIEQVFEQSTMADWFRRRIRVDVSSSNDSAIARGIEAARSITAYTERIQFAVGINDARLLRAVLGDGQTYAQIAAKYGEGESKISDRFCAALERLTDAWTATGSD
jgi:hypothetical protein